MPKRMSTANNKLIKRNKKFLLLATHNHFANGLRQLGAILLQAGFHVKVAILIRHSMFIESASISTKEWELLAQYVSGYAPDCIGVSLTSIVKVDEKYLFALLHQAAPQALIVCGGYGPTFESAKFLQAGSDYAVRGEGEGAMLDIAMALEKSTSLKNIENVAYLRNGTLIENPLRPLIDDLDTLPPYLHGDEHFVFIEDDAIRLQDPLLSDEKTYITNTSRGCTEKCTYCAGGNWFAIYRKQFGTIKRYRTRSVEACIQELEGAKKLGARFVYFFDEYFLRPVDEFFSFFTQYKEKIGLPYAIMMHTDFLEKEEKRFEVFWQSGVLYVEVGIQSASKHICKDVFQRKMDVTHQLKIIHKYYAHRICTGIDFITAHILEREEDYRDSLEFIKSLPPLDPTWPNRITLQVYGLGLLQGATIADNFPALRESPFPENFRRHRILMMYIRHAVKDDDQFYTIYNNPYFRDNPDALLEIYKQAYYDAQRDYWCDTVERLAGKEVYFWGVHGDWKDYETHKHLFRHCKPRAMLINTPTDLKEIDSLTVRHPDDILNKDESIPIILFSAHSGKISAVSLCRYPGYTDLITCYAAKPILPIFMTPHKKI
jgi:radical SAM superfamily enzyme YgiQ (UPF0313 family)